VKRLFHLPTFGSKKSLGKRSSRRKSRRLAHEQLDARRVLAVVFGDFDGDGFDDMAAGVPGEDVGDLADAGAVNVIYGTIWGLNSSGNQIWHQDVENVEGVAEAGDRFGASLAVGDFNNDGYDDLAIGVPGEAVGDIQEAGAVNILFGSANGLTASGDRLIHQDYSGVQEVAEAMDRFGAVLSTGDYDGDGYDDLAVGVANENLGGAQDAGIVQIFYGFSGGVSTGADVIFQQGANGMAGSAERYDFFGAALASADFNHDGYTDLAVGAPGEDGSGLYDTGAVSIIYGSSAGLSSTNDQLYTQDTASVPDASEAWDNFGSSLAAGDFDNDGYADLAIGSPNEDHAGGLTDAGMVHVMYGWNGFGFDPARHQVWHQDSAWIEGAAESYDYYGSALTAGDFNGDGRDDLAIGVPGEAVGNLYSAGAVNLLYGTAAGLALNGDRIYHQDVANVAGVAQSYDYFGSTLAAGDTNNDGYADLAVGSPWDNDGGVANSGLVHVFRGQNSYDLRTDNDTLWHQDSANIDGVAELNDNFGGSKPESMDGGVPRFESDPNATKHLYLDFNGGWSNDIYTTYFKLDDINNTNRTERALIEDIWAVVAEDFAPFKINVTTVLPTEGEVFRVLIGGDGSERQANPTSGWKGGGDYTDNDDTNNDVYVYSARIESWYSVGDNLALRIGTTASHEAGHGFGLGHKSTFHAFGAELDEYSDGGSDWTPIMGGNLATDRTIWAQEYVSLTIDTYAQGSNDFSVLQSELGLRNEDHWSSLGSATNLGAIGAGGMLTDTGLIKSTGDIDAFRFQVSSSGNYNINVMTADVGANLNSTLKLYNSAEDLIASSSPSNDINASLSKYLTAGTYYIAVGSQAEFTGDVGKYTLRILPTTTFTPTPNFAQFAIEFDGFDINRTSLSSDAPVELANPRLPPPPEKLPTPQDAARLAKLGDDASYESHKQAVDSLMADWSEESVKHLQRLGGLDWYGAISNDEEEGLL
jgi:hypothetical protein